MPFAVVAVSSAVAVIAAIGAAAAGVVAGYLIRDHRVRAGGTTLRGGKSSGHQDELLFESVTDYAIAIVDPLGRVVSWNEGAERISGYREEEVAGKSLSFLLTPDREESLEQMLARAAATGRIEVEGPGVRKDGTLFSASASMTPMVDPGGMIRGFALVTRDVSARRQFEHARSELFEILQNTVTDWTTTFDAVNVPIVLLDDQGEIRRMNREAQRVAGRSFQDLIYKPVAILPGEPWQTIAAVGAQTFQRGSVEAVQAGSADSVWQVSACIARAPGRDPRAIVVAYDMTRVARLEAALRQSEVSAALGAMVAGVAHEVRNPLFTISATLDAWQIRYQADEGMARYAGTLREQVQRLNRLMNDLLEYGKPRSLCLSPVSLSDVLHAAAVDCASLAEQSSVEIELAIEDDISPLFADAERLEQVFVNVIDNAIHHSPQGATIRVSAFGHDTGVTVNVIDEGDGVSAEDEALAFNPFYSRRRGGTGLGLPIARQVVSAHGGQITLHPRQGSAGAVASIRLPYCAPGAPMTADEKSAVQESR